MRIATLSLNPAIDQTARVPSFTAGRVNRVEWEQSDAGGKGVNVASFLADAGLQVAATGLFGSANIEPFLELFARKGIDDRCVRLAGRTRVNVKITDPVLDQVTDINFPGLSPTAADLARLTKTLDQLLAKIDWLVLSGSVPAGVPSDIYAGLIDQLQARGKQVLLDASGAPFAEAVSHGPDIIKPNIDELAELVGRPLAGPQRGAGGRAHPDRKRHRAGRRLHGGGRRRLRRGRGRRARHPAEDQRQEHRRRGRRHGRRHPHRHRARAGPRRQGPARHRLLARRARGARAASAGDVRHSGLHDPSRDQETEIATAKA